MNAVRPELRSRALPGLIVPGLGHLLCGDVLGGLSLLAADAVWVVAATSLPRWRGVLDAGFGQLSWHGTAALVGWVLMAVVLWGSAWRLVAPRARGDGYWERKGREFARCRNGRLGLYGALILAAITLLTPMLTPFDPIHVGAGPLSADPSWLHPLGTDRFGRDMLSRLLYGGRVSMSIGFVAVAIAATVGTFVGGIAGFAGGWVDKGLMWVVDLLLSLPRLVLLLAIVGMFHLTGVASLYLVVAVLGLTGWMGVSRIVRAEVLSLRQRDFVSAARGLGFSPLRILTRHLIPNAIAPVIVFCSLAIGTTILAEAGLSFLGLGVPQPTPTWGTLVNEGRDVLQTSPWITTSAGLAIVAAVMSFNMLGDGLRDALDPRMRGS